MPPAVVVRAKAAFADARSRSAVLDLLVRVQGRYGRVGASQQAGAVTYFAFLSFFPVLALAAFAVGVVENVWPEAGDSLTSAIDQLMPGLVGPGEGQVSLDDVQRFSGVAGIVGLVGVLYAGLGWIDALRTGLLAVFEVPAAERPDFLTSKRDDLVALVGLGIALFLSVVGAQTLSAFSEDVTDWLGFGWPWLLWLLTHVLSWAVSVLLFGVLFALVGKPDIPRRSLLEAAAIGALGFEIMKMISFALLGSVKGSPAFQAFGVALVLLVWINYFTRVVFYAASYACEIRPVAPDSGPEEEHER